MTLPDRGRIGPGWWQQRLKLPLASRNVAVRHDLGVDHDGRRDHETHRLHEPQPFLVGEDQVAALAIRHDQPVRGQR